jgi:hypothetical protein
MVDQVGPHPIPPHDVHAASPPPPHLLLRAVQVRYAFCPDQNYQHQDSPGIQQLDGSVMFNNLVEDDL